MTKLGKAIMNLLSESTAADHQDQRSEVDGALHTDGMYKRGARVEVKKDGYEGKGNIDHYDDKNNMYVVSMDRDGTNLVCHHDDLKPIKEETGKRISFAKLRVELFDKYINQTAGDVSASPTTTATGGKASSSSAATTKTKQTSTSGASATAQQAQKQNQDQTQAQKQMNEETQLAEGTAEKMWVVKYKGKDGNWSDSQKTFSDKSKADAHAARGNMVDRVGGKYSVHAMHEEVELAEGVKNPYAVGMAAAEKSTGDTPPLKKSTINKAHEIAKKIGESKDSHEYDYEGDMALNQLAQMMHHIGELKSMLKPETNLPEWVQLKITLAADYIQTASDYLSGEMKEEAELEEGRGRPPKEGSAAWHRRQAADAAGKPKEEPVALGMQLRKAKSINAPVTFDNGEKHEVHPSHVGKFEDHMAARKTTQEKAAFQKKASASHEAFKKAVSEPLPSSQGGGSEVVKYRH